MFNKKRGNRPGAEVNSGSMADIAFLLLIFFLVTTTIASDKGIPVMLPPKVEMEDIKIKERNIFNILVNSNDMLLVEGEVMNIDQLKDAAKRFITNNGQDPESSESPQKAVLSLKTDRGTSYDVYIKVRDILQLAYTELRAQKVGVTPEEFMEIAADRKDPANAEKYDEAKDAFPIMISDAEPTDIGS